MAEHHAAEQEWLRDQTGREDLARLRGPERRAAQARIRAGRHHHRATGTGPDVPSRSSPHSGPRLGSGSCCVSDTTPYRTPLRTPDRPSAARVATFRELP
ncbi:hypothetical protein ACFTWH_09230 [Streptomyces sp. NPDC057011]|uniref:hypothetical protein n=1 Tax=unclassified Streptomyces TaxID=2593676 RepID=UPI0036259C59